jgi:hypothetical protein
MLNGLDPIIIFSFKKLLPSLTSALGAVPVVADNPSSFPLPLIPIYLSESLTGIYIDSENKSLEIDTNIDTLSDGSEPTMSQKALSSTIKIEMKANRASLGISLFAALADLILPKVTSKEYAITYLHGAVTVFDGLLHSFSISQNAENDLYTISLEIVNPGSKPVTKTVTEVSRATGAVPL